MSTNDRDGTIPSYEVVGDRPEVYVYKKPAAYTVGDKVWYVDDNGDRHGPYLVQTAPSAGKCTLSGLDGTPARGSESVEVSSLEEAK